MANSQFKKLRNCVNELNQIEEPKLAQLTLRVARSLISKNGTVPETQIFTDAQMSKLQLSLGLNETQVMSVVAGLEEAIQEAAYHGLTADQLLSRLQALQLDQPKASAVAAAWGDAKPTVIDSLANIPVIPQVSYIGYNLTVEAASDLKAGDMAAASPSALRGILHLGLTDNTQIETEFSQEQLTEFHAQLNRIQAQLDAIADK